MTNDELILAVKCCNSTGGLSCDDCPRQKEPINHYECRRSLPELIAQRFRELGDILHE